jgi:hypothetical protein
LETVFTSPWAAGLARPRWVPERSEVRHSLTLFSIFLPFANSGLGSGGAQTMTDAQIDPKCQEAKRQGLRSLVHAISDRNVHASVIAGCSSIERGIFTSNETLEIVSYAD